MKKYLLLILSYFFILSASTGQERVVSKEEMNIWQMADDTAKVNRLNEYAEKIQFSKPVRAIENMEMAIAIAQKLRYSYGLSVAFGLRASLLFYEMKIDSCRLLLDKAYGLVIDKKDRASRSQVANILNRYAAINQRRQNYDSAVEQYLQAANIFKDMGDNSKIIFSYYNLSGIYKLLSDTAKTIFYAKETNRIASLSGDTVLFIRGLIALSEAYYFQKNYDSVLFISIKGLKIANDLDMTFAIGIFNNFIGLYFTNKAMMYDMAITHYNVALNSFKKINTQYDIALVLQNLGNAYLKKEDYTSAIKYLKMAAELSANLEFDGVLIASLLDLVKANENLGKINESYEYLKQYTEVNDSIQKRNSKKKVYDMEAKYLAQKSELIFNAQQKIIHSKNQLNYLLTGSVLLLIIIGWLLYYNYQGKQKLQLQQLKKMEAQQQLAATEAVLKGEEQERTRISKDLHDGLGGMLSGIKYSFTSMKENLGMTGVNKQAFERSMDMLDSSIKEMRRVAHNMMPGTLSKFGLDTALKDFCNDINQSGALQVLYQSFGMENSEPDQSVSFAIYRIVQELINNTMKHAAATNLVVQLTRTDHHITVTVEDDGKGFDTTTLHLSKGIGWSNVQNRVEFLKGTLDVKSELGKGTSIHIELNT